MKELIKRSFLESIEVNEKTLKANLEIIVRMVREITKALRNGNKIIFFGNGGSAADSQHLAAELIGRFEKERRSLAAIALTTDTSSLTALGNDYGFDAVFARQLQGLGRRGDVAVAISTSGNSKNVLEAVRQARKMGIKVLSLTGCGGGKLACLSDISLIVPSRRTARIQESHICAAHVICELVEKSFPKK
ncbi:MAG TPA: D-sedoheptulose 7-phosphate isomerase [Candidatus Omnitrophota bacterium]|nr:D-sedoheptulose 7-phosphate isomerase [Candidatus Omnitrophota bacterium]HPD83911.1 D-sedoheptulose 7-phosphate isomerase [Candidatus Omnitrophota bacterium]HRZ02768.1 D-sedoheptulose 7-phosphate isomerase [Candidatus Omnitrophota bacterium]